MHAPDQNTIVFDITTSSKWGGAPVGIVRVERELTRFASSQFERKIVFSIYDSARDTFFRVNDEVVKRIVQGEVVVESERSETRGRLRRFSRKPRRYLIETAAEVLDRKGATALQRAAAIWTLKLLKKAKDDPLRRKNTEQWERIPFDVATSEPIDLGPATTLVSAGLDWEHKNLSALYRAKQEKKFRYAAVCYDVIPWKFPHFVGRDFKKTMLPYFTNLSWVADTVLCISHCTARDYASFCDHFLIPPPKIGVFPLGSDILPNGELTFEEEIELLPPELEPGEFILFVSTIEPRKNHRLLYNIWERMTKSAQNKGIKLVWVGRRGWMIDDLLREVEANPIVKDNLLLRSDISNEMLNALYRHCLFTVFPSFYEGYGLPVAESLRYGKVCVAARAGSVTELAGDLIPLLDPLDAMAWIETLSRLISNPMERETYERRIRKQFVAPTWEHAASSFFAQIQ